MEIPKMSGVKRKRKTLTQRVAALERAMRALQRPLTLATTGSSTPIVRWRIAS